MVTHSIDAKNAATDAVIRVIGDNARLVLRTAGTAQRPGTPVSTLRLTFNKAAGGLAIANDISVDRDADGARFPVETATIETSDGQIIVHCSVSKKGGDIKLQDLVIDRGDTVMCESIAYAALKA